MRKISSDEDLCFRYGGEEFGILVKGGGLRQAEKMAERLRLELASANSPTGKPVTISAGIAAYPGHGKTPEDLIKKADKALYHSKASGRNLVTVCG